MDFARSCIRTYSLAQFLARGWKPPSEVAARNRDRTTRARVTGSPGEEAHELCEESHEVCLLQALRKLRHNDQQQSTHFVWQVPVWREVCIEHVCEEVSDMKQHGTQKQGEEEVSRQKTSVGCYALTWNKPLLFSNRRGNNSAEVMVLPDHG